MPSKNQKFKKRFWAIVDDGETGSFNLPFSYLTYTQDSVSSKFHDGVSVEDGEHHLEEAVRVTVFDGQIFILCNRTALAKELQGHTWTTVEVEPYRDVKREFKKKNTGDGTQPIIRHGWSRFR